MIEVKNISKTFKIKDKEIIALSNISFTLDSVGSYAIYGKSGSGKTTLLKILYGLKEKDSGEILVDNVKVNNLRDYNCVYIAQDYGLLDKLTVYENFKLMMNNNDKNYKDIDKYLEKFNILDLKNKKARYLSGGERARVAFARALSINPRIILADEPSASLDPKSKEFVYDIIKEYSKEHLILVISHDEKIKEVCDNLILIDKGELIDYKSLEYPLSNFEVKEHKPNIFTLFRYYFKNKYLNLIPAFFSILFILLLAICLNIILIDSNAILASTIYESDAVSLYTSYDLSETLDYKGIIITKDFDFGFRDDPKYLYLNDELEDNCVVVSDYILSCYYLNNEVSLSEDGYFYGTYTKYGLSEDIKFLKYDTNYYKYVDTLNKKSDYLSNECYFFEMNTETFKKIAIANHFYGDHKYIKAQVLGYANNQIFTIADYGTVTDSTHTIKDFEVSDDEIILPYLFFDSNYEDYIGQTIDLTFYRSGNSVTKTFTIKDINYGTGGTFNYIDEYTKNIITSTNSVLEIISSLFGNNYEEMINYGYSGFRCYDLEKASLDSIKYVIDNYDYSELTFFNCSQLYNICNTIDKSKLTIKAIMIILIILTIFLESVVNIFYNKQMKYENRNLREINYKPKITVYMNIFVLMLRVLFIFISILAFYKIIPYINNYYINTFIYNATYISINSYATYLIVLTNVIYLLVFSIVTYITYKFIKI